MMPVSEPQRREDRVRGRGHRSTPQHNVPRAARQRSRGADPHLGQDAQALHPHPAGRPRQGRVVAVRSHARTHRLPLPLTGSPLWA